MTIDGINMGEVGFGAIAGIAVGYTAKKITKLAALLLGSLFIAIQILSYLGWISVDWGQVQQQAEQVMVAEDGVSRLDQWKAVITANLPFAGSFLAGFAVGYKIG